MPLGKKESKTVTSITGSVTETDGIIANVLNYSKTVIGAYFSSGDTGVTIRVYGSLDIENTRAWMQIGNSITGPAAAGNITPIEVEDAYDGIKVTYAHTGATYTTLTLFVVRKRR